MSKASFIQTVLLALVSCHAFPDQVIAAAGELQKVPEAQFYNPDFDVEKAAMSYVHYRKGVGPKPEFLTHAGL